MLFDVATYSIPLATLIVAAVSLFLVVIGTRAKAGEQWVRQLEHRIKSCEDDRNRLQKEIDNLRDENQYLQRRVRKLENGH